MDNSEFRAHAHQLVDWMADYLENIRDYPVKSQVGPGDIYRQLPTSAPAEGEAFETIFGDFERIIMPGMTHWQHPSFHAYFPANASPPSVLAEMLTATLGAQCMSWQTSPAATELEQRVMEWLREMIGLPAEFTGVIQDTASTATLCSILTAREQRSDFLVNDRGLYDNYRYAVYCSSQTHSSIEKAVKIAGLGRQYLRKIEVDRDFAMKPEKLEQAIRQDLADKIYPLCAVAALGTTGSTAVDPIRSIGEICRQYDVWLHIDAAFAGTALLLPEMRWMNDGVELADTFVFNPHKWMFTNFDCTAYFVRDPAALVRTFEILPEYLKTAEADRVNNYRDWGLQLGRRFRALKLWFVIRSFGVRGLQERIRTHLRLAKELAGKIENSHDFELLAPVPVNLICFRYRPDRKMPTDQVNSLNERLVQTLNESGNVYLTHTKLNDIYTLRLAIGQTQVTAADVARTWELIQVTARSL